VMDVFVNLGHPTGERHATGTTVANHPPHRDGWRRRIRTRDQWCARLVAHLAWASADVDATAAGRRTVRGLRQGPQQPEARIWGMTAQSERSRGRTGVLWFG
jgi:hypothetical protein